jgi:hypothetical protein
MKKGSGRSLAGFRPEPFGMGHVRPGPSGISG